MAFRISWIFLSLPFHKLDNPRHGKNYQNMKLEVDSQRKADFILRNKLWENRKIHEKRKQFLPHEILFDRPVYM